MEPCGTRGRVGRGRAKVAVPQDARVLIPGLGRDMGAAEHGALLLCAGWVSKCQLPSVPQGLVQPVEASRQFWGKSPQLWGLLGMVGRGADVLLRETSKRKRHKIHPGGSVTVPEKPQ